MHDARMHSFTGISPRVLAVLSAALALTIPAASAQAAAPTPAQQDRAAQAAFALQFAGTKLPHTKPAIPAKLAKALPGAAKRVDAFTAKLQARPFKPTKRKSKRKKRSLITSAGGGTMIVSAGSTTIGGVKVEVSGEVNKAGDALDTNVILELSKGSDKVQVKVDLGPPSKWPEPVCPTAEGKLDAEDSEKMSVTAIAFKDGKVKSAVTKKFTTRFKGEGKVESDARFARIKGNVDVKIENYSRGEQIVINASAPTSAEREGAPQVTAPPTGGIKIRSAGMSRGEEAKAEKSEGQKTIDLPGMRKLYATLTENARDRLVNQEYYWYSVPNPCASAEITPQRPQLGQGDNTTVSGEIRANSGGVATGSFEGPSVTRGSFSVTSAAFAPGQQAKFSATGGAPGSDDSTVEASVIGASTAGRAKGEWTAVSPPELPTKITGTIGGHTTQGNNEFRFSGQFNFKLDAINVIRMANGAITAYYMLDTHTITNARNTVGGVTACEYVAETSSPFDEGTAWVDISRASADAPWKYGVYVQALHKDRSFIPKNCEEGSVPFTRDIRSTMYTGPAGNPVRWVTPGASKFEFSMNAVDELVRFGPVGAPTYGSWSLASQK